MPTGIDLDLAANDPLVGYLLSAAGAVDITNLRLASPALKALQAAGVVLVVPLISSGSLVGLLSLGPRMSERGYSSDDLRLLNSLAGTPPPRCGSASWCASRRPRPGTASASSRN